MEGMARITFGSDKVVELNLQPLEIAQLIAYRHGFWDVDCKPGLNGSWEIVCTRGAGKPVSTFKGRSLHDACEALLICLATSADHAEAPKDYTNARV